MEFKGAVYVKTEDVNKALENYKVALVKAKAAYEAGKERMKANKKKGWFSTTSEWSRFDCWAWWSIYDYMLETKDIDREDYDALFTFSNYVGNLKNLCSVGSEYVILTPNQARFVSHYKPKGFISTSRKES